MTALPVNARYVPVLATAEASVPGMPGATIDVRFIGFWHLHAI